MRTGLQLLHEDHEQFDVLCEKLIARHGKIAHPLSTLLPEGHKVRQALQSQSKRPKKSAAKTSGSLDAHTRDDGDVATADMWLQISTTKKDTRDKLGKQEVRALGRKLFKRNPTEEEEDFLMGELQQDRDDDGNVTREEFSSWCVTKIFCALPAQYHC